MYINWDWTGTDTTLQAWKWISILSGLFIFWLLERILRSENLSDLFVSLVRSICSCVNNFFLEFCSWCSSEPGSSLINNGKMVVTASSFRLCKLCAPSRMEQFCILPCIWTLQCHKLLTREQLCLAYHLLEHLLVWLVIIKSRSSASWPLQF